MVKAGNLFPGIFSTIQDSVDDHFLLRVAYLEIYNEQINDLLGKQTNLRLRDDKQNGVTVETLKEEIVKQPEEVLQLIATGEKHRQEAFGLLSLPIECCSFRAGIQEKRT